MYKIKRRLWNFYLSKSFIKIRFRFSLAKRKMTGDQYLNEPLLPSLFNANSSRYKSWSRAV